jgi:hypothetical protein
MNQNFRNSVIFDLDGCLFDDSWRRAMIKNAKDDRDYDEYHKNLIRDKAIPHSVSVLQKEVGAGNYTVFITARPLKYWAITVAQINETFGLQIERDYFMYMRPNDDRRKSVELKRAIAEKVKTAVSAAGAKIICAYDDRMDVVRMYNEIGIAAKVMNLDGVFSIDEKTNVAHAERIAVSGKPDWLAEAVDAGAGHRSAADILAATADLFRERNAVYKDNYKTVGKVMAALFPNGVQLKTEDDYNFWHLFELTIVKMTRFTNSGMRHVDSLHDMMVYVAMCEATLDKHKIKSGLD